MSGPVELGAAGIAPGDPRQRLLDATRQLEAVFFQQLLQVMRGAQAVSGGLFEPSPGELAFRDLFDESIARLAAERSGRGPGVAMYQQLSRHLPAEEAAMQQPLGRGEHRDGMER